MDSLRQDSDVAAEAVRALNDAHRGAVRSGKRVVLVQDGELVCIGPAGKTVLKTVAPREKVSVRFKRATP